MVGWAIKNYKLDNRIAVHWEFVSALIKLAIVAGAEFLVKTERSVLLSVTAVISLVLHAAVRPYNSKDANIVAIVFILCQIIGSLESGNATVQITFIVVTLLAVLFTAKKMISSVRATAKASLSMGDDGSEATYTKLEKSMLFPILIFRSLWRKLRGKSACPKRAARKTARISEKNQLANERTKKKRKETSAAASQSMLLSQVKMRYGENSHEFTIAFGNFLQQKPIQTMNAKVPAYKMPFTLKAIKGPYESEQFTLCFGDDSGTSADIGTDGEKRRLVLSNDKGVAKKHAVISLSKQLDGSPVWWLYNLSSVLPPNGVWKNGEQLQPNGRVTVEMGDFIQLGANTMFEFTCKRPRESPPPDEEQKMLIIPEVPGEEVQSAVRDWDFKAGVGKVSSTKVVPLSPGTKTKVMPMTKNLPLTKLVVKIIGGPHEGQVSEYSLHVPVQILIGNDEKECNLVLDRDEVISGQHAAICWDDEQEMLIFESFATISKVNGMVAKAEVSVVLTSEDEIEVGGSRLVVLLTRKVPSFDDEEEEEAYKADKKLTFRTSDGAISMTPKIAFAQFDLDGDGCLSRDEFRSALQVLGCTLDDDSFEQMFVKCDKDRNGTIDIKEFKKTLCVISLCGLFFVCASLCADVFCFDGLFFVFSSTNFAADTFALYLRSLIKTRMVIWNSARSEKRVI